MPVAQPVYSLLPWVRRGLASYISGAPAGNSATLPVSLAVNGEPVAAPDFRLSGPGDIKSMDARAVIRTDPRDRTDNFEPNYLATVEFGLPDFPWLFTPAAPVNGRLQPWICLVVVPDTPGASITVQPDGISVLRIDSPLDPAVELPDLADIDMWAHAQVTGEDLTPESLSAALVNASAAHLSRLISPRKLDSGKRYLACVVPTYLAGVNAGLGLPVLDGDLVPAWGKTTQPPLTLPVYYSFSFQTGPEGDFKSLVQKIKPRDPVLPHLAGDRLMDVSNPRFGFTPDPPPELKIGLEGALRPLHYTELGPWPTDSEEPFKASLLAALTPKPAVDPLEPPVVTPPVYGRTQAGKDFSSEGGPPAWLRDLNLDPKARATASAGAQVVQRDQEALIASAWKQLGEIRKANQLLRQAQLARHVTMSLASRHLDTVADEGAYLQITAPVHARVRVSAGAQTPATMRGQVNASRLPPGAVSPAFRKLVRPRGPVGRQLAPTGRPSMLVPRLMQLPGSLSPLTPAASTFNPSGMVTAKDADFPAANPPPPAERRAKASFEAALFALGAQLNAPPASGDAPRPALISPREQLRAKLNPQQTIRARVAGRIPLPADGDPLRPQTPTPVFPQPMYAALAELSGEWLFPGISGMLLDTTVLLKTNPRFVEALLIGLNDEMSRELLWREVPVDLRGTFFKNFWGATKDRVNQPDIKEDIASFNPVGGLGSHTADPGEGKLVLLVRSNLFRRYPNTLVSAIPAGSNPDTATRSFPMFRGQIGDDVYFFGFDKPTQAEALGSELPGHGAGWYFLFEEHPTEPRFGLEPAPPSIPGNPTWNDFEWTQVTLDHNHLSTTTAKPATPVGEIKPDGVTINWGSGPAEMAYILMRRPVRMALHARALIEKD